MEEQLCNWYILFPNHHNGLRLSQEMRKKELKYTVAPAPRAASTSCGMSLIVEEGDLESIQAIIGAKGIQIEKIVPIPVEKNWTYRSC